MRELTLEERKSIKAGEPISIALVMTYLAVAFVTVAIWKLYTSSDGKFKFPGGFEFQWNDSFFIKPYSL